MFEFPKASKERAEALAFKKLHWLKETEVRKEFYSGQTDPELTLKPNLTQTLKDTRIKRYHHNGRWEINPATKEEGWSCCMNNERESEGRGLHYEDKDKWILSSCC